LCGCSATLSLPTRALIALANVLLPGKGLKEGPFFIEQEIRSLAEKFHLAIASDEYGVVSGLVTL
jgi:Mg2+/Co2+ transporter CorC